jgi:hypothetical protein
VIAAPSLALGVLTGCIVGRSLATFEPARSPHGITLTITGWTGIRFQGELLALADSGLLMLVDERVAFVYGDAIERVQPTPGAEGFYVFDGDLRSSPSAQRLIPLSRYPAGVSRHALAQLLTACSQELPEPVRARRR